MFHVGNFHSYIYWDLNPGPPAPFTEILPLYQEEKRQPFENILLLIDIVINV